MSMERYWAAVAPVSFTVGGTIGGVVTVASTAGFKVGQLVQISGVGLPTLTLKVKRVFSSLTLAVGSVEGSIDTRTDISAYTVAATSAISATLQRRPSIPLQEIDRAVYSEEPAVAIRTIQVDQTGTVVPQAIPLITDPFDYIGATYPAPTVEVYTYRDGGVGGVIVGVITVTYTDATKANLLNVAKV